MISHFRDMPDGKLYLLDLLAVDHPPWVILFTNDADLESALTLDDLDEADFSGYARVHPTWPASSLTGGGDASSLSPACVWTHNGGPTANEVRGIALVNDAGGFGTRLIRCYKFPVPITMSTAGDNISRQVRLLQGQYPLA